MLTGNSPSEETRYKPCHGVWPLSCAGPAPGSRASSIEAPQNLVWFGRFEATDGFGAVHNAASHLFFAQPSGSGHLIPAVSARARYSFTVPRPIEQLRAICRWPRPNSYFSLKTSLIFRMDRLLAGNWILQRQDLLPVISPEPLCPTESGIMVNAIPGTSVRLHPGIAFGIIPESCSPLSRNRAHLRPEYAGALVPGIFTLSSYFRTIFGSEVDLAVHRAIAVLPKDRKLQSSP